MPFNEQNEELESEISEIERKLAEKRNELTRKKEAGEVSELPHEKETLHKVVGEKFTYREGSPAEGEPVAGQGTGIPHVPPPKVEGDTLSYLSEELRGAVQNLTNVAFNKSIDEAVKMADASGNTALIKAFHNVLVDELYDHLVERGKLKSF